MKLQMNVVATDSLYGGFERNVPKGCKWIKGDLRNPEFVSALFADSKFDYVYHLAAYAAEGLSHFIRRYNYETNLLASVNLINEAVKAKVRCFIFTSSIAVYGAAQTPMTEDTVPLPEDPYGISKLAVEMDLKSANKMFGLDYVIFRPHNVYGERQNIGDRYRNVIGIFMNQTIQGQPMTVFGDGKQTRAFSNIDDVAPIIARAPEVRAAYNQIFNVGADVPHTISELAHEVAFALGSSVKITYVPARKEVCHAFADHSRAREIFGVSEPLSLRKGLARMANWALKYGSVLSRPFDDIEIEENLPTIWNSVVNGHGSVRLNNRHQVQGTRGSVISPTGR
jgi:UDP-glucose 4-epimerase